MSTENRKIGHYAIVMSFDGTETFDSQRFKNFLMELINLPRSERLENMRKYNKALLISHVSEVQSRAHNTILNVAFTSCKYNHAPDYMSSIDGAERATSKHREEGEQELTHFSIELKDNEGYAVFEERKSGVSIGIVLHYLNTRFYVYQSNNGLTPRYTLEYSLVPHDDFLDIVDRSERICNAELFVDKEILGSDFLNFSGYTTEIKDELSLFVLPRRNRSVDKPLIRQIVDGINRRTGRVSRVRIKVKDDDGVTYLIDTLNGKRKNEIVVDLNENGVVNSESIFRALVGVLTENE